MEEKKKEEWGPQHKVHAFWFEKGVGLVVLAVGTYLAFHDGCLQYFGFAMACFGLNATLPSSRALFSNIVDRLPFLADKEK